jgi:hypothetical protein
MESLESISDKAMLSFGTLKASFVVFGVLGLLDDADFSPTISFERR